MLDSIKSFIDSHPAESMGGSLMGYLVSTIDILDPVFSFILLTASMFSAIFVAYVWFAKAKKEYYGTKKRTRGCKKSNNNS